MFSNPSMKIVYIVTAFPRNENDCITPWLVKTIQALQNKGNEIIVFTSAYKGLGYQMIKTIPVYRFRYFFSYGEKLTHDVAVPERLKQGIFWKILVVFYLIFGSIYSVIFAMRNKFDVIHVHWGVPHLLFGYIMKLLTKNPLICTFHGAELVLLKRYKFLIPLFKWFVMKCDYITVNSSWTKQLINKLFSRESIIIPFGGAI